MQRLIIRLGSQPQEPIFWLVFSEQENEIIASGQLNSAAELSTLQEHSTHAEVIGLAPTSDIYFTQVQVPQKGARKALAAIPFMVEEELATNIDDLFFALGENKDDRQEVAVMAKSTLRQWQTQLTEAGLFCQYLIPDAYCLPNSENICALQLGEQLLVKMPNQQCFQGEVDWLLPVVLEQAEANSQSLTCYSEITNWPSTQDAEFDFDVLPMQLLLNHAKQSHLNIFQGEFAVKRQVNPGWDKWKLAASLAVVALCANLIFQTTELNHVKQERAEIRQQTATVVTQGFPEMGKFRAARLKPRIEKELLKLEQGGGNLSMLAILTRLSNVFSSSGVKPQSIRYDSKRSEIRMQSVAKSFEALEKFKRDAQTLGFEVEQGAINNRGDEVVGVIVVRG